MKKRILALMLALALLCQMAAATAGTENFKRQKSYRNEFSDLSRTSCHYENIVALYEYGFSVGKGGGSFGCSDPVSGAELVTFAARIRSSYEFADPEYGAAQSRHEGFGRYLNYAQVMGIVAMELEGAYDKPVTRAMVAHVLAGTLPQLDAINDELVTTTYALHKTICDVTEYTPYQHDILQLYRAGIARGSDSAGNFHPESLITRSELASLLMRLVLPASRVLLDWASAPEYSAVGATWGSLIGAAPPAMPAPESEAELRGNLIAMLAKEQNTLHLQYPAGRVSEAQVNRLSSMALRILQEYCEQMYNYVSATYSVYSGKVSLSFGASGVQNFAACRSKTLARAIALHDALWAEGRLTSEMSEREKAWVYYNWICDNCVYDTTLQPISHTAYSLFEKGNAVCDGYSGAYNLLLKLEGISCSSFCNGEHMWTLATLDGVSCHIDVTWGDTQGVSRKQYFAMTERESRAAHAW